MIKLLIFCCIFLLNYEVDAFQGKSSFFNRKSFRKFAKVKSRKLPSKSTGRNEEKKNDAANDQLTNLTTKILTLVDEGKIEELEKAGLKVSGSTSTSKMSFEEKLQDEEIMKSVLGEFDADEQEILKQLKQPKQEIQINENSLKNEDFFQQVHSEYLKYQSTLPSSSSTSSSIVSNEKEITSTITSLQQIEEQVQSQIRRLSQINPDSEHESSTLTHSDGVEEKKVDAVTQFTNLWRQSLAEIEGNNNNNI
jgi:hypothetical protein